VLLRGRRALPVVLAGVAAVLPAVALIGMNLLNGTGGRNAEHLRTTDGQLSWLAVEAWSGGDRWAALVVVALALVGAVRARGVRVVGAAWVVVPLLLLTLAELVRPVYLPRYLLAGLLGLAVLAAAGAAGLPRVARVPAVALLLGTTLIASLPLLDRAPRERADEVVTLLARLQSDGEPVVAADLRSSIGLDHYTRLDAPQLRDDVVLPPDDAPPDADRVWLVRRTVDGIPTPTDDDGILRASGLAPTDEWAFPAVKSDLVVQLWTR
jgi:hypothetical protein